jgi:hypothetical protein
MTYLQATLLSWMIPPYAAGHGASVVTALDLARLRGTGWMLLGTTAIVTTALVLVVRKR